MNRAFLKLGYDKRKDGSIKPFLHRGKDGQETSSAVPSKKTAKTYFELLTEINSKKEKAAQ